MAAPNVSRALMITSVVVAAATPAGAAAVGGASEPTATPDPDLARADRLGALRRAPFRTARHVSLTGTRRPCATRAAWSSGRAAHRREQVRRRPPPGARVDRERRTGLDRCTPRSVPLCAAPAAPDSMMPLALEGDATV